MSAFILASLFLTVTNQAGMVRQGEYVRTTRSHLFLRDAANQTFSVPYAALSKRDRDRVQLAVGVWQPPQEYRDLKAFYEAQLKRIDLLEKEKTLTAEEAEKQRAAERKSFEGVRNRLIREGRLPNGVE